jgi:hypothetical protein
MKSREVLPPGTARKRRPTARHAAVTRLRAIRGAEAVQDEQGDEPRSSSRPGGRKGAKPVTASATKTVTAERAVRRQARLAGAPDR